MTRRLGLIVTDASPLITLAAGDALECLTMPGVTVIIPDMVYAEVTEDLARLGADDVVQWARRHHGQVEFAPTSVFAEFQALRAVNPRTRSRGRGEQAALEVLNAAVADDADVEAVSPLPAKPGRSFAAPVSDGCMAPRPPRHASTGVHNGQSPVQASGIRMRSGSHNR